MEAAPIEGPGGQESGEEPDSIVPESWFARPRKTEEQRRQEQEEEQATYQWQQPPPMSGATQLDHPQMNFGQPMGPPPMGGPMGPMEQGPMGPMQGGYYPPPGPSSSQASKPLLIAVSALVAIALVAVTLVLWPGGDDEPTAGGSPSPSSSKNTPVAQKQPLSSPAKLQAIQVNKLLNSSAATKGVLARALNGTSRCATLPSAIRGFRTVAQRRGTQVNQTNRLKLDKLRNGERMRTSLRQSFQASLEADLRLLAWANKARQGCKGRPRPDVAKAPGRTDAERRATLAKRQFVTLWNPVAKQAGLPSRAWNGL
jgi:hypothetical protein